MDNNGGKHLKKMAGRGALLCMLLLLSSLLCGFRTAPEAAAGGGHIKATMYFGNTWQINFWTGEHFDMDRDFSQIAEDGFNTVILVVPWRAFQPSPGGAVSQSMLARLDDMMSRAEAAGLGVMLRVGYTWDMASGDDVIGRFNAMVYDKNMRASFKQYAASVCQTASKHANFAGAFLTWEDFWNYVSKAEEAAQKGDLMEAGRSGYSAYILEKYDEEELAELYGNEKDARTAPFPTMDSPAYGLFLEWYDTVLMEILEETQEVFPGISMECRLHQDNVYKEDGTLTGYSHHETFAAGNADYTSAMLSVDMAAGNGTDGASVAGTNRSLLAFMKGTAGKPVFVDQFLYQETTPGFDNLAHISGDMNGYLTRMGGVFRDCTIGYGLWSYRDYTDNLIYNPEFGLALDGWTMTAGKIESVEGNHMARIKPGGMISQNLSSRAYLSDKPSRVRFRVIAETPAVLTVMLGGKTIKQEVEAGDRTVTFEYDESLKSGLTIMSTADVLVDDIQVYSHVTEGGIYDLDGNPGPNLSGLRALNAAMD